ncbi:glycogen synthase [Patescibacteria group bacterium]|nr:glycogen synthase [Patescibacteria group bacterium]MBU1868359.1 glycogen synthase [Patescibacteria group bacterium]
MKVLFAASECAPLVKVGGLGDVIGSLPQALREQGADARVVIPFYEVIDRTKFSFLPVMEYEVEFEGKHHPVKAYLSYHPSYPDFKIFLLENDEFLVKGGDIAFAGTQEEIRTYAFFSQAVVELVSHLAHWSTVTKKGESWVPDLIHCHDWHTGIIPQLIKTTYGLDPSFARMKVIFTIHNLSYQGISGPGLTDALNDALRDAPLVKWDLQDNNVDLLLQGIIGSDMLTTVSPTYAKEILTPEFGEGLQEVLKAREGRIKGILNGIDYQNWNPAKDECLSQNYQFESRGEGGNIQSVLRARSENKKELQKRLDLPVDEKVFLLGFVSRLDGKQKGLDLLESLIQIFPQLSRETNIQLIILGTGEQEWEERLRKVGEGKDEVSINIKFDSALARLMFGCCDSILMPSRFEPCGLPQMIAMRYGALPIVRAVGGLKDSVENEVDGFSFSDHSKEAFLDAISRAERVFRDRRAWQKMMEVAMKRDFSWRRSAGEYLAVYRELLSEVKNGKS